VSIVIVANRSPKVPKVLKEEWFFSGGRYPHQGDTMESISLSY
jgi:hypothetical protein